MNTGIYVLCARFLSLVDVLLTECSFLSPMASSKTFRFPYVYLNPYRPPLHSITEVRRLFRSLIICSQTISSQLGSVMNLWLLYAPRGKGMFSIPFCVRGADSRYRGFLRKAKSVTSSTTAPVIIDKHELHSTWPVYCQPEQRHISQDDITLIVERNRTCFGPGDRISVVATVKSDSLHTVILRGFQILLKEATVFRPNIAPGRRAAPLANQVAISETKVDVNATLYGGTSHNSELACMVPANHTTPTLTSARHIDVTYTLSVKALLGTGTHLAMELPIIMSNWQRCVCHVWVVGLMLINWKYQGSVFRSY